MISIAIICVIQVKLLYGGLPFPFIQAKQLLSALIEGTLNDITYQPIPYTHQIV